MKKIKYYMHIKYPPEIIDLVVNQLYSSDDIQEISKTFKVGYEYEDLFFDNINEFYAAYRNSINDAELSLHLREESGDYLNFDLGYHKMQTVVSFGYKDRRRIEQVFEIFESNYSKYTLSEDDLQKELKKNLKIFIGHGHNAQWKDLKDHLQDKHGFRVIAYEVGVRAGYTIVEVLEDMLTDSTIAFLVLTGEDKDSSGNLKARENVIHETGLFQGKLGFKKSIILLEEGCNEFSNIDGIQQLRFSKGNIKEIFGDIIAIINREFEKKEKDTSN